MSEKRVAPPDGGSGDLVLIQRHLENLSAGEILKELDARMEEMTDQSCDPELIRLYLDVLRRRSPWAWNWTRRHPSSGSWRSAPARKAGPRRRRSRRPKRQCPVLPASAVSAIFRAH